MWLRKISHNLEELKMILLTMFLIAPLIAGASIVVITVFQPKWNWLRHVMLVTLGIAVATGIACGVTASGTHQQVNSLRNEYEDILIYYDLIDTCDNEYVRFDFYKRVERYNNQYKALAKDSESAWVGIFYPGGWQEEFGTIDFFLRDGIKNNYIG
jgi:hypothetical protein